MKKNHYTHVLYKCAGMLLLMLYAPWVLAQNNVTVTGKVTSQENNSALPGVNVVVKGTTTGTTTNAEGAYTISAPANSTIVFSFIGFLSEEVSIGNRTTVDIGLAPDIKALTEVVVIGYGEREKKDLTSSISVVSAKEIEKSVAIQPELALQGRAAGVFVSTPGGNPNARPQVRIRGEGTFNFSEPLYVVDGVPITEFGNTSISGVNADIRGTVNVLSLINPADIESISVLKDAAAAAVYGVRASNGVILITTKKGKQGKPRVEVAASRGVQNLRRTYDMLNTQEMTALYQEASVAANQPLQPVLDPNSPAYKGNSPTYDWQTPLINRDALLEDYSVKLSGGSEATTYYISGGYSKTESPLVENDLSRYSLAMNVNSKINKVLSAGITYRLGYIDAKENTNSHLGYVARASPWQPIYDPNGPYGFATTNEVRLSPNPNYNPNAQDGGSAFNLDGSTPLWGPQTRANVFAQQYLGHNKYYLLRNLGSSYVQVEPLPGLRFKGTLSIDWFYNRRNQFTHFNSYLFSQTPQNPYGELDPTAVGRYQERHSRNLNIVKEFSVNYGRTFGDHTIDVLVNAMDQEYGFQQIGGSSAVQVEDPQAWGLGSPYERYVNSGTFRNRRTLQGYLGRVSYSFKDKYYLDATVRRDGSSNFAPGYKWGTFPGISAAWRISSESFMQSIPMLSDLKIRAGWGQLGNQEVTKDFAYASTISTFPDYNFGSGNGNATGQVRPGAVVASIPVPDLSWEVATTTNVGFDASLFNNKLTLTAEYYRRTTSGILQEAGLTPSFGVQRTPFGGPGSFNNPILNIGTVRNSGIELSAGYNGAVGDFTYNLSGNFTSVRNRVVQLFSNLPFGGDRGRVEVGQSMFYLWGYKVGGIFQTDDEAQAWKDADGDPTQVRDVVNGDNHAAGDFWFQDINGPRNPDVRGQQFTPGADGRITPEDRTYLGKTIPGYFYGFNLGGGYKGFDVSIFFQGVGDVQKFNEERADGEQMSAPGQNQWRTTLNRWPYDRSSGIPRAMQGDLARNNRFSDRFVENAGFMRLKNMQIGYSLPKTFLTRLGFIDNFRVYVSGTNLLTFTKWTGLDPETIGLNPRVSNESGGTARTDIVPPTRSFVLGVNAAF